MLNCIVFVIVLELELKFCNQVEIDLVYVFELFVVGLRETHVLIECIYV